MRHLRRKLTTAALTVGTVLGTLAASGTAHAGTEDAVQIQVCNEGSRAMRFYIVGYNDWHDWVDSRFWEVPANDCTLAADYWWQIDRSPEFHYVRTGTKWTWQPVYLGTPDNGSTVTICVASEATVCS